MMMKCVAYLAYCMRNIIIFVIWCYVTFMNITTNNKDILWYGVMIRCCVVGWVGQVFVFYVVVIFYILQGYISILLTVLIRTELNYMLVGGHA